MSDDPRTTEVIRLLTQLEPLIRQRIREFRGPRDVLLSTSELYASVVEELFVHDRTRGLGPADGPPVRENGPLRNLSRITRDSVTWACRAVLRWRHADQLSMPVADRTASEPLSSLDRSEFRRTIERLIDGLGHEDREILYLRMKGQSWAAIAATTGMTDVACRQRWVRMVAELRHRFPHD